MPLRRTPLTLCASLGLLALACTPGRMLAQAGLQNRLLDDPANLAGERVAAPSPADTLPVNHGAAALQQLLLKLGTRASLMLLVAHPDDEDGGMLTYESRGAGARVAMLTLTRGEGGQNLMSADFNEALGLIRTEELLAADRIMGVDQLFGTEVDFGFSKTKEESFAQWTHERVLYDAVRAVRLYRPLVLASVFVGGVTDGHGHHQVAGEMTQEVFKAAADPTIFPDMGLAPWAPLKVYARVPFARVTAQGMYDYATGTWAPPRFHNYITGTDLTQEPAATVLIHEGDPAVVFGKPALGMDGLSWVQFARQGLALQKTQIGVAARLAPAGRSDTGYTLMATRVGCTEPVAVCAAPVDLKERTLFDGIDISLGGIAELAPHAGAEIKLVLKVSLASVAQDVATAQAAFDPAQPQTTAPSLEHALRGLDRLLADIETLRTAYLPTQEKAGLLHELRVKRVQLNDALTLALGIDLSGTVLAEGRPVAALVAGRAYTVQPHAQVPPGIGIHSLGLTLTDGTGVSSGGNRYRGHGARAAIPSSLALPVDAHARPNEPYFRQTSARQAFYTVELPALRNAPKAPAPLELRLTLDDRGIPLEVVRSVVSGLASPGDPAQAAAIVPAYSLALSPHTLVLPRHASSFVFTQTVTPALASAAIRMDLPPGWTLHTGAAGEPAATTIRIDFPNPPDGEMTLPVSISTPAGIRFAEGYRSVGYPGIPHTNLYEPATLRVVPVDVVTAPGLRVGYLPGTGDSVADYLPGLGIAPTLLTVADLTPKRLSQFDTVVLGVRAYAAHPELAGAGSKPLLDFAAQGGTVVVQYNTTRYGGTEAPFPIDLPGDPAHNVVVEAEPVRILEPSAPALSWPNRITAADFNGWVEERGHGFPASFSSSYQAPLEAHDPGQDPQRGGLLLADVGRGHYIYCALALYRQLPEGVPGAYRLLANLLSLGHNPARQAGRIQPVGETRP